MLLDPRLGATVLRVAAEYAAISPDALHVAGGDRPVPGPSLVAERDRSKS
jgi:hypothetical protein